MKRIDFEDWGIIDYISAFKRQKEIVCDIINRKDKNIMVFCEHPPVITIGKNGSNDNILLQRELLENSGVRICETDRGGDVTLHNPGQLVGYFLFDLRNFRQDLHWFLRLVEECLIELISPYGIAGQGIEGLTGVWIGGERKIAAMGFHCSRWVTSHGFALNVNNNLNEFSYIIPCGLKGKEITSMEREVGTKVDFEKLKCECREIIYKKFSCMD